MTDQERLQRYRHLLPQADQEWLARHEQTMADLNAKSAVIDARRAASLADAERAAAYNRTWRSHEAKPTRLPRENWWITQHRNGWNPTPYPVWVQILGWVFVAYFVVGYLVWRF